MESTQLTAITYVRKSVGIDGNPETRVQQRLLNDYAKQQNYQVIKRYKDVSYKGVIKEQPGLVEMLADLKEKKIDCLLVYSINWFGRDLGNNIKTMLAIFDSVKEVWFINEDFTTFGLDLKRFLLLDTLPREIL